MRIMAKTLAALFVVVGLVSAQSNMAHPEKFTAFAINMNNTTPTAAAGRVDITVSRWSTDAERDRLLSILKDKGQDALLSELRELPVVGYIASPGSLRYDLHFARQRSEAEGGRMVFLMTDRYIGMWEAVNRPRTIEYPFTLIQLQLDKDGEGVGKASVYTKVTAEDNMIVLENFANQPVMLKEVKEVK